MATTQQQPSRPAPQAQAETRDIDPAQLLDQILQRQPNQRVRLVADALEQRVQLLEEMLPGQMKGQGRRLAKRATMTLARDPKLAECPAADFIRCVLEAAELGLAIDGKIAYVVRYKNVWQFQADYKALIGVARRNGLIDDAYADVVCEGDFFEAWREGGHSHLKHAYNFRTVRGEVIGAYAVVVLPGGRWRFELMNRESLDGIQRRAPSKNGPWSTDTNEMRKKTVLRRLLKLYVDDPGFMRAWDEPGWGEEEQAPAAPASMPVGRNSLRTRANGPAVSLPTDVYSSYPSPPHDQTPRPEPDPVAERITEEQHLLLSDRLRDSGANVAGFLKHFGVPVLAKLPAARFDEAMGMLGESQGQEGE